MKNVMSIITRSEYGDSSFVLNNLDYLCSPFGAPKFEFAFIIVHNGFHFTKDPYPDMTGLGLFIPLFAAINLSREELQVMLHWSFVFFTSRNDEESFSTLIESHGIELTLATLLKANSMFRLWKIFSKSSRFSLLARNNSSKVLSGFEKTVLKPRLPNAVSVTLSDNQVMKSYFNRLSQLKKEIVLKNASKINQNSLFDKHDRELQMLGARLFWQQSQLKDAVA